MIRQVAAESMNMNDLCLHSTSSDALLTITCFAAMEDAHAIELNLENPKSGTNTFFAVYDGHGGKSYPANQVDCSLKQIRTSKVEV